MSIAFNESWVPQDASAVVPSDTAAIMATALYVGTGGNLVVEVVGGKQVTFAGVPGGTTLWLRARKVRATGTTAANIVALS